MMLPKLGIIAGGGVLPTHLAHHCLKSGRAVFAVLLAGQAVSEDFAGIPHAEFRLGAAGAAIKRLHAEGAETVVFAGHVHKPPLSTLRPDLWSARFLVKTGLFDKGDDTLLQALIQALEAEGFTVVGADDVAPGLLAPAGCLTKAAPSAECEGDIETGIAAARALGARDAGQAVVVAGGRVVAEEDRRGTDAMLRDIATGMPTRGVLVKVLKPGQERRADLPTIGPGTIVEVARAGLSGIAVSAGDALIVERAACVAAADDAGIFIFGVPLSVVPAEGGVA